MYVSDYGYAASPDAWTNDLLDYDNLTITSNNWLYMGLEEWTITTASSESYYVFSMNSDGSLSISGATAGNVVRPVFYLNSNVEFSGGTGTQTDPYTLAV